MRLLICLAMLPPSVAHATADLEETAARSPQRRPNIVFILADDMGYGDVQVLNEKSTIPTPNLNRLAAEGMTFVDAHTPSSVCTPTRYGLLTGRYCWRTRLKHGVLNGYSPHLIDPGRQTVASMLKTCGYHTAAIGKWHLGLDFSRASDGGRGYDFGQPTAHGPTTLGFDFFYGIPASLDFAPYFYVRNDRVVELPTARQPAQGFPAFIREGERSPGFRPVDCLDHLLEQAARYIRRRAASEGPFFLYFALTAPHKPVLPHPRFRGRTDLGPYGDFIVQVDWTVGQVLDVLDEVGAKGSTLVIFTSDNGSFMHRLDEKDATDHLDDSSIQAFRSDRHTANHVFRGTKADIWEGGHHVPFFARWPGKIEPGARCGQPVCLTDFFATCAEIVGAELGGDVAEDSFSLLPLMAGRSPDKPRPPVIHHSAAGIFAIRDGKWKLVLGSGSGGRQQPRGRPFQRPYHLFDLSEDIAESRNLAESHQDVLERLEAEFERIRDSGRSRPRQDP